MEHGSFHIRCQSEDCTIAYVFREMLVTNTEVSGAGVAGAVGDPGGHELKAGAESTSTVWAREASASGSVWVFTR